MEFWFCIFVYKRCKRQLHKALTENRDKVTRWVEYTESLYKDNVVAEP